MASIITATTSSGLTQSADNSGVLQLASGTGNLVTVPSVTGTAMVSGNMPAFSAYPTGNQTVTNSTWTKINFGTEEYDTNNNFASSRFTPTVAGYYEINARVVSSGYTTNETILSIYKNGSESKRLNQIPNGVASSICPMGSALISMNGTTDYLEIYLIQTSGLTQTFLGSYSAEAYFQGFLVRTS
jgi:hypothetical protein